MIAPFRRVAQQARARFRRARFWGMLARDND
jgi:hypothetical protein